MNDHIDSDHQAAAKLTAALIIAQATSGGIPQQTVPSVSQAAAMYLDMYAAIQGQRGKRERADTARHDLAHTLSS